MSYVDLATLTLHRRHELENRIHLLEEKCDRGISDIKKLKMKANSFVLDLNCEPAELKERFLNIMQKLEEYMYLLTDFNLSMSQIDTGSTDSTPVQDISVPLIPGPSLSPYNLIDALTEPLKSTSCGCPNLCHSQKPVRAKIPKEDRLIVFSSSSSAESVPRRAECMLRKPEVTKDSKETQCQMVDNMASLAIKEADSPLRPPSPFAPIDTEESPDLPPQKLLEVDHVYPASIIHADGAFFSVITDDLNIVSKFMRELSEYYASHDRQVSEEEPKKALCCFYDNDSHFYYRALFINKLKDEPTKAELYVVDTGEIRVVPMNCVQRLLPQFWTHPPFARTCHLAGVELSFNDDKHLLKRQEAFLKGYIGTECSIEVDDNSSETLGVYVLLPSKVYLNDVIVDRGLATHLEPVREMPSPKVVLGPPDECVDEFDVEMGPEYDDPVVAVTGYHNRDEADICKHYKGGPEKTCFKGPRCNKKHIVKHPDGWTYDQVEVSGKCESVPLPAPGTWHKVVVTLVAHFDRVYVQIQDDKEQDEIPEFGLVLPPTTLNSLTRDMNSPATVLAYKRLSIMTAPGEIVAALYPMDNCWYRAKVESVTRMDQSVEITYIDYGTRIWVKENQIRVLEARFMSLPAQAVQCVLAGVVATSTDSQQWAQAKRELHNMVQDKIVDIHIIAREFDEVIVELYDTSQYSVAETLASRGLVKLIDYHVTMDHDVTQKIVPS